MTAREHVSKRHVPSVEACSAAHETGASQLKGVLYFLFGGFFKCIFKMSQVADCLDDCEGAPQ